MSAYKFSIAPNQADSHQSQPWASICFWPYKYPDTFHLPKSLKTKDNAMKVSRLLVVSDILSVNVSNGKGGLNCTAEALLASGDLNYKSMVAAGDHALIWMHNDQKQFSNFNNAVLSNQKANGFNSGLKFFGKVASVREIYTTSSMGVKSLRYLVTFRGFTEFESEIYFNPLLASGAEDPLRLYGRISDQWNSLLGQLDGGIPVSSLLDFFVDIFFGKGPESRGKKPGGITRSPNDAFLVPKQVAGLFGITRPSKVDISYSDLLNTLIGVQKYNSTSFLPMLTAKSALSNQKFTIQALSGKMISLPDNFNNVTIWSLLDAHKNSTLNEMYTTLRVNQDNDIMPTLVVRQQPFTSPRYKGSAPATNFLDVPRWSIDPKMVLGEYNIGTTNATRCNFLQVYGQMYGKRTDPQASQRQQIVEGNFAIDELDIIRSGSKNFIMSSNADVQVSNGQTTTSIGMWKDLLADWYVNLHLKENGSITMPGIPEPIAIGDNLEIDGLVLHIEGLNHSYVCGEDGMKSFTTNAQLTHGLLDNGDYSYKRAKNRENLTSEIAPGFSDEERYVNDKLIISSTDGSKNGKS